MPQGQTKIMNEGWATYWHSVLMTTKLLKASGSSITPTTPRGPGDQRQPPQSLQAGPPAVPRHRGALGLRPFRQGGRTARGPDRRCWDHKTGLGREKIFQVRRTHSDLTFPGRVPDARLLYRAQPVLVRVQRQAQALGGPVAGVLRGQGGAAHAAHELQPADHPRGGRQLQATGELLLVHRHEGLDLDPDWGGETLAALARLWTRPANVLTERGARKVRLRHDGSGLHHRLCRGKAATGRGRTAMAPPEGVALRASRTPLPSSASAVFSGRSTRCTGRRHGPASRTAALSRSSVMPSLAKCRASAPGRRGCSCCSASSG